MTMYIPSSETGLLHSFFLFFEGFEEDSFEEAVGVPFLRDALRVAFRFRFFRKLCHDSNSSEVKFRSTFHMSSDLSFPHLLFSLVPFITVSLNGTCTAAMVNGPFSKALLRE